jgi:(1->4)-alpha-D-glucan 1-alpha-D-glucosylmutase
MTLPTLDTLCAHVGLAPQYDDFWGHVQHVPPEALRELLEAMGLEAGSPEAIAATLARLEAEDAQQAMPAAVVVRQGEPAQLQGWLPATAPSVRHVWTLECDNGERFDGLLVMPEADAGRPRWRFQVDVPPGVRLGYHRFRVRRAEHGTASPDLAHTDLIVAPSRCYRPAALKQGERLWGPCIQLYALRSGKNWGIGDFSDLRRLLETLAAQGASFIGLNPLHALFPHEPERASPYSPSSRNALNVLYIDVEAVPDFAECRFARDRVLGPEFQQRLQGLRDAGFVDYDGVAAAKFEVLEMLFKHFETRHLFADTRRGRAFRAFQQSRSPDLRNHALFDALQMHFFSQDRNIWGWSLWPAEYRDIRSPKVAEFARENEARIECFEYMQWQAEQQLQAAHARAESLGMPIGLYRDLAVGVNEGGSETWAHPTLYALGAHVGAPPEEYNQTGQDWGLPPAIPSKLRQQAYRPFIDTLRANMRYAGALRIDHVMALMRLFWVHPRHGAKGGAYMAYPFDDLMGILALESHRHRCLVIGEDLGTVPPRMREAMHAQDLLSYCPLFFEREAGGRFKPPASWSPQALAVVSTHDLPTLRGFWRGEDVDLRARLGLFPSEERRGEAIVARAQDRAQLLLALEHEGLMPEGGSVHPPSMTDTTPAFTDAVYTYLGRTPAQLVGVQLEDLTQQLIQVNVPGTHEQQFPNWRRKLDTAIEELASDPRLLSLGEVLRRARPSAATPQGLAHGLPPLDTALIPSATYRVQLHRGFRFDDARRALPYLQALGISHLYTSPYLKARAGSTHGYDIIDHDSLNPEVGDEDDFDALCAALTAHGMHQLIDVVPNHMGVLQADNAWWLDVLENGPASVHAETFDIDWHPPAPELDGQVLLPLLGDHFGKVLEAGELKLAFDTAAGEFRVQYHDHRFPIDPQHYPEILAAHPAPVLADEADRDALHGVESLLHALGSLPSRNDPSPAAHAVRHRDRSIHKRRLSQMVAHLPWLGDWINACLKAVNGEVGDPRSFDRLDALLRRQAYRLAFWRVAGDDVNYRRFFDVSTLAAVRMEREAVFEATHHLIFKWLQEGRVAGLRIDHPDGLADPQGYFTRLQTRHLSTLRSAAGDDTPRALYVVVEKILAEHERLPQEWPVHGGIGYRFSNLVNGLFVDGHHEDEFDALYARFIGRRLVYDEVLYEAKLEIMSNALSADLQVLTEALYRIAQGDRRSCDFTRNRLRVALTEVAAAFPVYRTYIGERGVSDADRQHLAWASAGARRRCTASEVSVIDYLRDVLQGAPFEADPARRQAMLNFAMRWQQFTAPVMAKSMEDTAFYRYHRLASLNDVGDDPRHFGLSVNAFHAANQYRVRFTPHTMLGSSTHDSKRSEDVRTRLDVLSEIPHAWSAAIDRWAALNQKRATRIDALLAPTRNDEYLVYQTLVGVWPAVPPADDAALAVLRERVQASMLKGVREAKEQTSWINPNLAYETALARFIDALLGTLDPNPFLTDFQAFVAGVAPFGAFNSLSLVAFKLTCPGVPDIYQGCETWNWSLVDPDNRRPVDLPALHAQWESLRALCGHDSSGGPLAPAVLASLREGWADGRIKMLFTWRLLQLRQQQPELFRRGGYQAVSVEGSAAGHAVAFARQHNGAWSLTVGSRLLHTLADGHPEALADGGPWGDTAVLLPAGAPTAWRDALSGRRWEVPAGDPAAPARLRLADLLSGLPAAVLVPVS